MQCRRVLALSAPSHTALTVAVEAALQAVEQLTTDQLQFVEGEPQDIHRQLPVGAAELAEAFEKEARALGYRGVISDILVRRSGDDTAGAAPVADCHPQTRQARGRREETEVSIPARGGAASATLRAAGS